MPDASIFAPDEAQALATGLFPDDVEIGIAYPWEDASDLMPQEVACLPGAIDSRLCEFAAGRRAARTAMAQLGRPPAAILHQTDRSPKWPRGIAGSISHTDEICVAVLGQTDQVYSLGLDIEEDADLPAEIWSVVCTQTELAWLSVQPENTRGRLARLIFCAKECAYKLQYPLTGLLLDFSAFEITPDLQTGQFEATLTLDAAPFTARTRFAGRFAIGANMMMTGMALTPRMQPD